MPARAPRRTSRAPLRSAQSVQSVHSMRSARSANAPVVPALRPSPLPVGGRTGTHETSAGGLVVRRFDGVPSVALIARLDRSGRKRWSLPKGHVEPGETTEQAAVREVREETGITGRITARLGSLSYSFTAGGRRIHKRVHHFLMEAESGELSDADIEVTAVAWVPLGRVPEVLAYAAERRMAHRAAQLLAATA